MRKITQYSLKKASEHVFYESWMFFESIKMLTRSTESLSRNILLDAFVIHTRNLFDFLYPKTGKIKPKKDDILAIDYIQNQVKFNQKKNPKSSLKFIVKKADKQVAHLTYSRNRYRKSDKQWPFIEIGKKMHCSLEAFYESLSESEKKWPYFVKLRNVLSSISFE